MIDNAELDVLRSLLAWRHAGHAVRLYTVVQTWGSAPRQPGAMMALRDDGVVVGSVSGGCIEDDLISRLGDGRQAQNTAPVNVLTYGLNADEAARFGLPCGGTLQLVEEQVDNCDWVQQLIERCEQQLITLRNVQLATGSVHLLEGVANAKLMFNQQQLSAVYGPRWRLLMIGAGQLAGYVADIAQMMGFEVLVCDPRDNFIAEWDRPSVTQVAGMPDDAVLSIEPDERTAIVTLSHDPRLDDMALMTALQSRAFYVGALGSRQTTDKRRQYLQQLGMHPADISRLHGPIGLHIGSHAPAEIALSLLAEIIAVKNGVIAQRTADTRHLNEPHARVKRSQLQAVS